MTPREILIAWAASDGFAAIHNGAVTDEQIVDDLLAWLYDHDLHIVGSGDALPGGPYDPPKGR